MAQKERRKKGKATEQQDDDTPPPWFLRYMEVHNTPQQDEDTPPTWFSQYMENYKKEMTDKINNQTLGLKVLLLDSRETTQGLRILLRTKQTGPPQPTIPTPIIEVD